MKYSFLPQSKHRHVTQHGFTLVELLTVIAIIIVLMGLGMGAFSGAQQQAYKVQAKNDVLAICNAVKAFNTEYGRYPSVGGGDIDDESKLADLLVVLTGRETVENTRGIKFVDVPVGKKIKDGYKSGSDKDGNGWFDPWGHPYQIRWDEDYDNNVINFYNQGAGPSPLNKDVIGISTGRDGTTNTSDAKADTSKDDVLSWM